MGVGILAPVPAVHLKSALETCAKHGRVAFGSDAWEFFAKASLEYGEGIPVLIYASPSFGDPDKLATPGAVGFCGTYLGTEKARAGKHPNPELRPATTVTDTAWAVFWELGGLVQLAPSECIILSQFTAIGQKKPISMPPRGPLLVNF
jgi:hypothetical protein